MNDNVLPLIRDRSTETLLTCPGVGRDAGNEKALCFYLSRCVTDDEMRYLHDVMQRAVAMIRQNGIGPKP